MLDERRVIVIAKRKDEDVKSPIEDPLDIYVHRSEPEVSATKRMLAVVLLVVAAMGLGGLVGIISFLAQLGSRQ